MRSSFRNTKVCFPCMKVSRSKGDSICPTCNSRMITLSSKFRVPKQNRKLWDEFEEWVRNYNSYYEESITRQRIEYMESKK